MDYTNEMDKASDNYAPAAISTPVTGPSNIMGTELPPLEPASPLSFAEDMASRRAANNPMGLPMGGDSGPSTIDLDTLDRQVDLSRAQEERLQSGQTITDYGNDCADRLGDNTANSVRGQRRATSGAAQRHSTTESWMPASPQLGSQSEYTARANQSAMYARQMPVHADAAEQAGNGAIAQQYRDMSVSHSISSQADLERASSITIYTSTMSSANPPEFIPGRNWSYSISIS
jgi:hypothetical protein